ncbi:MAG: AMP-binding protein [Planctomycetota bacterium]|nr:AMP-binding protein [Planctomycetota bacterium]MDA1212960.1 AMP-binding protein [Planctomycetota bacterium]
MFPHATSGIGLILLENLAPPFNSGELHSPRTDSVDSQNLGLKFLQIAQHRGSAPLVTTNDATYSYSSLSAAALSLSRQIRPPKSSFDTPGERVILLLPNSPEYIAAFYGVLLAGQVVVPVAPKIEAETLRRIVETTDAKFIITTPNILRTRPDLQSLHAQVFQNTNEIDGDETSAVGISSNANDANGDSRLAAIFFTGGSSGTPKGVMLSHRNLMSNAHSIRQYLEITEADNPLCILPFMHAFGNSVLQSHVLAGARLTIAGNTAFPQTIVAGLKDHACTSLSGVPDLFRMLMSRSSLGRIPLGDLRYMAVAGGALPQQHAQELAEKIAPSRFFVMYGQTEATARLAYVPPEQLHDRPDGAIGQPVPGVTLEIVNQDGNTVAPGEIGELRARGPNIMLGYWSDPDATSERIRDGWLYTGDLATRDEHNRIVLRGRSSSFVKIAGFRVHPQELEEFAVRRFEADQAVAVPFDGSIGTRLGLFLKFVSESIPDLSEVIATCRAELPHYLTPEVIQIVDDFPLNHAMKIDRPALENLAQQTLLQRRISA